MTWKIALVSAGASLLGALFGAGIPLVIYMLRVRAERASRFESEIVDLVTRALVALGSVPLPSSPSDDEAERKLKRSREAEAWFAIRRITGQLQLLCRFGDLPRALDSAFRVYTAPQPKPDPGAALKAYNRLIRATKKELGLPSKGVLYTPDATIPERIAPALADYLNGRVNPK